MNPVSHFPGGSSDESHRSPSREHRGNGAQRPPGPADTASHGNCIAGAGNQGCERRDSRLTCAYNGDVRRGALGWRPIQALLASSLWVDAG